MVLRIRCGQPSGCNNVETGNRTASLTGGLFMWCKDSKGNWCMTENEITGFGETESLHGDDPAPAHKVPAVASLGLGPDSSVYLFSSLARGA